MPIMRASPSWGTELTVGMQPLVPGITWPFQDYLRGGWSHSRGTEGYRWCDSPRYLYPMWTGGSGHKRIAGVMKDSADAPLAGVTCKAFRTTDDVANSRYVDQREGTIGISDAAGNYEIMVPTSDAYQVQSYKTGSPDVAGCTVNTLVGV